MGTLLVAGVLGPDLIGTGRLCSRRSTSRLHMMVSIFWNAEERQTITLPGFVYIVQEPSADSRGIVSFPQVHCALLRRREHGRFQKQQQ